MYYEIRFHDQERQTRDKPSCPTYVCMAWGTYAHHDEAIEAARAKLEEAHRDVTRQGWWCYVQALEAVHGSGEAIWDSRIGDLRGLHGKGMGYKRREVLTLLASLPVDTPDWGHAAASLHAGQIAAAFRTSVERVAGILAHLVHDTKDVEEREIDGRIYYRRRTG